jgi:hypothetical protein
MGKLKRMNPKKDIREEEEKRRRIQRCYTKDI